ncbi:Uma2 family endonuclease, partial [bacterium]
APEGTFVAKEDPFDLPRTVVVPDVLVLKGDLWSYDELNPSTALLAIEVEMDADRHTLARKASLYAEAEIPEYLLVDVARSRVIQFRDPEWDGYRTRTEYRVGEFLTILGRTLDARVFLAPQPEDLL